MCKYCKRLKELKELEKKCYTQIINDWKRRDQEACEIISQLSDFADMYGADTSYEPMCEYQRCQRVLSRARLFLDSNWIGK